MMRPPFLDDIDLSGLPTAVDPLSYVRVARGYGGTFGVATYDFISPGNLRVRERWFGGSEGRAMLVAQWLQARGYRLGNYGRSLFV